MMINLEREVRRVEAAFKCKHLTLDEWTDVSVVCYTTTDSEDFELVAVAWELGLVTYIVKGYVPSPSQGSDLDEYSITIKSDESVQAQRGDSLSLLRRIAGPLYCLGHDEALSVVEERHGPLLSKEDKQRLRLAIPHELWPHQWIRGNNVDPM